MSSAQDAEKSGGGANADISTLKPTLSAREQEILMAAWLSIKGPEPQINYDRLAIILGLKNAHTASTIFYNVKKKIKQFRALAGDAADETQEQSTPSTPKSSPRKRARAPKPAKPAKRIKSEAYAVVDEEDEAI